MKCPNCGGTGTSNWCVNGCFKPCDYCDGTGEVENQKQTNFQRITASPESLAEYLSNISTMPVCEIIGYCDKCPLNEKCQEEPLGDGDQYEVWLAWLEQECD